MIKIIVAATIVTLAGLAFAHAGSQCTTTCYGPPGYTTCNTHCW